MCEKFKWGVSGLLIGLCVSAIVVATNKKVQRGISNGADMVVDKFNDMKDVAAKTVKSIKKKTTKPKAAQKTASK